MLPISIQIFDCEEIYDDIGLLNGDKWEAFEDRERKRIWICDMACPQENNIEAKVKEKLDKYQQLAFETRENRVGYKVEVIPLVVGCLGGGIRKLWKNVQKVIETETEAERIVKEMQKTVLMDSESTMRKITGWNLVLSQSATLFMSETTNHIAPLNNGKNRGLDVTYDEHRCKQISSQLLAAKPLTLKSTRCTTF